MPSRETVRNFIETVEAGRHDEAIERFYTEDASMQENLGDTRVGRAKLVEHERNVMALFKEIRSQCVGPFFIEGDRVVINWQFEFIDMAGNSALKMDEIAVQQWQGEKVHRERFYYDPGQRK